MLIPPPFPSTMMNRTGDLPRITLDGNTLRTEEAPIVPLALVEVVKSGRAGWPPGSLFGQL
jgi:hypothetical protein